MKKLLLLLLCVPLIGFGQNRYHLNEVTSPNDTLTYLKEDMSLVSGVVYYESSDWREEDQEWLEKHRVNRWEETYSDGVWILYRCWFVNGQLSNESKKGPVLWTSRKWYENGQLRSYKLYDAKYMVNKNNISTYIHV